MSWINKWVEYTEQQESPVVYRKWVALSTVSSVLKRRCYFKLGHETIYPNLYVVLVGPSGVRKSSAMRPARSILQKLGIEISAEATTRESLIRRLERTGSVPTIVAGGVNMDCALTIHSSELTVFLGYNNQQIMADLSDWYDCSNLWVYETKKEGKDEINNVWVNLIGATTPHLIQSTLPLDAIGGGLTSRILFIFADKKSKLVSLPELTDREVELEEELIDDLRKLKYRKGEFKLSEECRDLWIDWTIDQEANPPFQDPRFDGYVERRRVHVLKICMIISSSESESLIITQDNLITSIKLIEEIEIKMPLTFGGMGRSDLSEVLDPVMRYIAMRKKVAYSTLMKKFYLDVDDFSMQKIIQTLKKMDFCREVIRDNTNYIEYLEEKKN